MVTKASSAAAAAAAKAKKRGRRGGKKRREKDAADGSAPAAAAETHAADSDDNAANGAGDQPESFEIMFDTDGAYAGADAGEDDGETARADPALGAPAQHADDADAAAPRRKTRRSKKGKTAHLSTPADFQDDVGASDGPASEPATIAWTEATHPLEMDTIDPMLRPIDNVEPDLRQYFEQIEKHLEEHEFETTEEMQLFINNAFTEAEGKEIVVAADFTCSRILEKLLRAASDIQIRRFASSLAGSARRIFCHQYASHVVETVLKMAGPVVDREITAGPAVPESDDQDDSSAPKDLPSMEQLVADMCSELDGHWSELMFDQYASHSVRTLLTVLSGKPVAQETKMRSKRSSKFSKEHNLTWGNAGKPGMLLKTPESFTAMVKTIVDSLTSKLGEDDLFNIAMNPVTSPILQIILDIPGPGEALAGAFLRNTSVFSSLVGHQVGSHLAEQLITKAPTADFNSIFATVLQPRFLELCQHGISNFVMQRVFDRMQTEDQLADALSVLEPEFEQMLFRNRTGIIVKAVEAAVRFPSLQHRVVKSLLKAFHVDKDAEKQNQIVTLVLHMTDHEKFQMFVRSINVQGSLMLQHIFKFTPEAAKVFTKSMLAVSDEDLLKWAVDPRASHAIEDLIKSPSASSKAKRKLIRRFQGHFVDLACDKFGSRVSDGCWAAGSLEIREAIAEELAARMSSVKENFIGKFSVRNFKIELFKQRRAYWDELQQAELARRDKIMAALAEDATAPADEGGEAEGGKPKKRKKQLDEIDMVFAKKLK
ncbi:Nucleolar protein 9 [Polyrhizophydium stewartii]|uniref:Nucleolar protein 9 n=1 Tax=Polyrhizophydium stewartii TaxID=2732419 RepID=A0ABR4MXQ2_9FUNG|nr:Nucleolar protein 9 [Polyrhizophydium stewartii]